LVWPRPPRSVGVIFYELLAGALPSELRKIAFDEFLRRLREEEAPKAKY
jgi:hypothetical protein